MEKENEDSKKLDAPKRPRTHVVTSWLKGWMWFTAGAVAGSIGTERVIHVNSHPSEVLPVDNNADGKADELFVYSEGLISRAFVDRGFRGKFDSVQYYTNGVVSQIFDDINGDGVYDHWEEYQQGRVSRILQDTDFNGVVDSTTYFKAGLPYLKVIEPNQSGKVTSTFEYSNGLLRVERSLNPENGTTNTIHYDAFEQRIPGRVLEEPNR